MDRGFFRGAWKIAVIMGIPIRIHFSWLIVFGLITWSLSTFYFPQAAPDLPYSLILDKGGAGRAIAFCFGGIPRTFALFCSPAICNIYRKHHPFCLWRCCSDERRAASSEGRILDSPCRPLVEHISQRYFFHYYRDIVSGGAKALSTYLAQINLFISLFNLIPGFPMDGGRILRSAIWGKTRNFFYATQKASGIGRKIALFFIFIGVFSLFTRMPGGSMAYAHRVVSLFGCPDKLPTIKPPGNPFRREGTRCHGKRYGCYEPHSLRWRRLSTDIFFVMGMEDFLCLTGKSFLES